MRALLTIASLLVSGCAHRGEADRLAALLEAHQVVAQQQLERERREGEALGAQLDQARAEREAERQAVAALEENLEQLRSDKVRILEDRGELRREVEEMRAALEELERRRRATESRVAAYRDLVDRFRSLIDAGTLEVRIIDGRMVVILSSDILFPSGSAALSAEGQQTLTSVAEVFAGIDRTFQVEGHTDDRPISTERYPDNWYLGAGRAIGVVKHLIAHGVPGERLSAASYGDRRPRASNETEAGRARNRRIEIVVLPDLSELPGADELAGLDPN